jgi:hypothetical protein
MRGNEPDTPGSTPRKHNGVERDHSDGDEANGGRSEGEDGSGVGFSRPDQVFDLGMDYDDEDVLLDWEQYAGMAFPWGAPSPPPLFPNLSSSMFRSLPSTSPTVLRVRQLRSPPPLSLPPSLQDSHQEGWAWI